MAPFYSGVPVKAYTHQGRLFRVINSTIDIFELLFLS